MGAFGGGTFMHVLAGAERAFLHTRVCIRDMC